ncbi:uncharacterized protein LOC125044415 [Penaeus chinensis]|uniref:uncharacterized protein LOC125044415 n=1 Tax=Penaeus chinensis TaxID=139456 RepID=UPI001FB7536D|nr:uncharacterized protein LOC125044415 [Penaeus chinensis]
MNLSLYWAVLFVVVAIHTANTAPRKHENVSYMSLVRKRRQGNHTVSGGISGSPRGKPAINFQYDYNPNDNLKVFVGGSHTIGGGTSVGGGLRWIIPTKKDRKRPKED